MEKKNFIPPQSFREYSNQEMVDRAKTFCKEMQMRRSVRTFSDKPVQKEVIENCIKSAASAPSGANLQPWHFVVVSNKELKRKIRDAAEKEEREFYSIRAPKEWLENLEVLGTDANKPFLETAPYLIVIFEKKFDESADLNKKKLYYTKESVGIATGILIAALHNCGLVSLTHTPSPMNFLNQILDRPKNERPFLILVAGYPAKDTVVPNIEKKKFEEITTFYE